MNVSLVLAALGIATIEMYADGCRRMSTSRYVTFPALILLLAIMIDAPLVIGLYQIHVIPEDAMNTPWGRPLPAHFIFFLPCFIVAVMAYTVNTVVHSGSYARAILMLITAGVVLITIKSSLPIILEFFHSLGWKDLVIDIGICLATLPLAWIFTRRIQSVQSRS